MADEPVAIEYLLSLQNGVEQRYVVRLDAGTMALRFQPREPLPEWTRLSVKQCPNCPLDAAVHPRCPVAVGLVDIVEAFKNRVSHEVVEVTVVTSSRTYRKRVSLQEVVTSLMGLHMATGGCPILDKLRPMVATHLPFATAEEAVLRMVSTYLLAQHFRAERGLKPDWELQQLVADCEDINAVNTAFGQRLQSINTLDASLNALVSLDCFAGLTGMSISQNYLDEMEGLFEAYLGNHSMSQ